MRCASLIAGAASLAVEAVAFTVSDANRGAAPLVAPLVKATTAARAAGGAGAAPSLLKTLDACLASLNSVDAAEPDAGSHHHGAGNTRAAPRGAHDRLQAHEKTPKGELKKLKRPGAQGT